LTILLVAPTYQSRSSWRPQGRYILPLWNHGPRDSWVGYVSFDCRKQLHCQGCELIQDLIWLAYGSSQECAPGIAHASDPAIHWGTSARRSHILGAVVDNVSLFDWQSIAWAYSWVRLRHLRAYQSKLLVLSCRTTRGLRLGE
jgi:hypothetical protein